MARESRYEIETYLLHDIRVRAVREDGELTWSVRIDIRRPNGEHYQRIEPDDQRWGQSHQAMLDGFRLGRQWVSAGR